MNWGIYAVECVVFLAVFTVMVMGMLRANPVSFLSDYPPEIQERYYRTQGKEATKATLTKLMVAKKLIAVVVCLFVLAWMAHLAGAQTFLQALGAVYGYLLIWAAFDTLVLDWCVFTRAKWVRLPGTEDMDKEYAQKWFHVKVLFPVAPMAAVAGLAAAGLTVLIW